MKMKKFALITLLIVLLFTFHAGQRPNVAAVRARADDVDVWNLYMHNCLIVPNDNELVEEVIQPLTPTTTSAAQFIGTSYEGTRFTLANYTILDDNYLDISQARLTVKDNSNSYCFVFNFASADGSIEEIVIQLLISEDTQFNAVPLVNVIPYDLTDLKLYGLQVYICTRSVIEEYGEIYFDFGNYIAPIPYFHKSLYKSGGSIGYANESIYPAACFVANENTSKFFDCDFCVILPDSHSVGNTDEYRTQWYYNQYTSYAQFNLTAYPGSTIAAAQNSSTFNLNNSFVFNTSTYTSGYDGVNSSALSAGDVFELSYEDNNLQAVRLGQGTSTYTVGYYGAITKTNVQQYASISNVINICPAKFSLTPGPQPQPGDDDYSDVNVVVRYYNEFASYLWATIYALVAYPVAAIVNVGGWLITGGTETVIPWENVRKSVNDVQAWLYSSLNNVARTLGRFFSKVGSALKTFFTETLPHFFRETLPKTVKNVAQFVQTWWWALVIGGLVILAAVVAIMIINNRR